MEHSIYEKFRDKTRVAICGKPGSKDATDLMLHLLHSLGNHMDLVRNGEIKISEGYDFVLMETNPEREDFLYLKPNIALILGIAEHGGPYENFINTITSGGIIIYNSGDPSLSEILTQTENYVRKIGFESPKFQQNGSQFYLETDLGEIPVTPHGENLDYIEGVRHLCQHLGIQQEDFYEALMTF